MNKCFIFLLFAVLLSATFAAGGDKFQNAPNIPKPDHGTVPPIPPKLKAHHFAGWYKDGSTYKPCYWSFWDGGSHRTDLPGDGIHNAFAYSPVVAAPVSKFYTAGYYNNGSKNIPCYWEGAVRHNLHCPGDGVWVYATSIALSGSTVYVSGHYSDGLKQTPCYWAGAQRHDMPGILYKAYAHSIAVSDGTVYMAGRYDDGPYNNGKVWACYWVGTTRHDLPGGRGGSANSIALSGKKVYVAGYGSAMVPCYWVITRPNNITRHDMPCGNVSQASANSIAVSGGTVYTAGYYKTGTKYIPCYWKGTIRHDLPVTGGGDGIASAIIVSSSGKVYTGGWYRDVNGNSIPCYWEGTILHDLPGNGAVASGSSQ